MAPTPSPGPSCMKCWSQRARNSAKAPVSNGLAPSADFASLRVLCDQALVALETSPPGSPGKA
jgi:hypothetical protein